MDVAGIAWLREEDYPALLAVFEDGWLFDSYEEWLGRAEEFERTLQRHGCTVERVCIDPVTFPEWCRKAGIGCGREARVRYAGEMVERKYGGGHA
jgi:hypothetical protein